MEEELSNRVEFSIQVSIEDPISNYHYRHQSYKHNHLRSL